MKSKVKIAVISLICIAVVTGGLYYLSGAMKKKNNELKANSNDAYSFRLEDVAVTQENIGSEIRGNGVIQSSQVQNVAIPDGYSIVKQFVNDGDAVNANQSLFQIKNSDETKNINSTIAGKFIVTSKDDGSKTYAVYSFNNLVVNLQVSEYDVAKLAVGNNVAVTINALGRDVPGYINYISSQATDSKFSVSVSVPYSDDIKLGYSASLRIITAQQDNVVALPGEAVFYDNNDSSKTFVVKSEYKKEMKKLTDPYDVPEKYRTYVTLGQTNNEQFEVKEGLAAGDKVLKVVYGE